MFCKKVLAIGAVLCAGTFGASAQIESGGLGFIDPWGLGFLKENEQPLPQTYWQASDADTLLPLMAAVRTRGLTPAEQTLLRRVVLSPGRAPGGERSDDLLAERARLMFELGEAEAAATLLPRLNTSPEGIVAEELSVDLQLALGQEADACAKADMPPSESAFWTKLRAVCFALKGNTSAAELAIEFAQSAGVEDDWLFNAVLSDGLDLPSKPTARFDTGLNLALSSKAGLPLPDDAITNSRPDLAAAMAIRGSLPPALRVQAAGVGAEAGLVSPAEQRAAYEALLETEGYTPLTPVEAALTVSAKPGEHSSAKSRALGGAVRSAKGSSARFSAVSRLLKTNIDALNVTPATARQSSLFAAAQLAAGDPAAAQRWTVPQVLQDGPVLDAFEHAWLDGLIVLAGVDMGADEMANLAMRLVEGAGDEVRGQAAFKLLSLLGAMGNILPPEARAFLATPPEGAIIDGRRAQTGAILAAAHSDAAGEVVLLTLQATQGDPSGLDVRDLTLILIALNELGLERAARDLALEATGYWKAGVDT